MYYFLCQQLFITCFYNLQVEVLENARSLKFLGCFPNPQDASPCTKNSLLFSCLHKKKHKTHAQDVQRRSSSDENIYAPPTEFASPSPYDTEDTRSKEDICSTDDEEYILSGFRKRPKTFYCDPNRSRESEVSLAVQESIRTRRQLESSASLGSQMSYDESEAELSARNARRPSQLNIAAKARSDVSYKEYIK